MNLQKPPILTSLPCSTFCIHASEYLVDRTYQREPGTWKRSDEQFFIDTILRGYGMPPIFIHKKEGKEYIVDGQQRFNTIQKFFNNKLELGEQYSHDIIKLNKGIRKYQQLDPSFQRERFDAYPIPIIYLENYGDEEIRNEFRRLNAGKPLNVGERLNAFPGEIVPIMRNIGKHNFFRDILPFKTKRYKNYHIASILMLLESNGIGDISPKYVYDFFERNHRGLDAGVERKLEYTLNFLSNVFAEKTPELQDSVWIVTVYLVTSYLLENYVVQTRKKQLKKFFIEFYNKVYDTPKGKDSGLYDFYDAATSGTTSQKNIQTRFDVMLKKLTRAVKLVKLDENRIFTHDQKLKIFRKFDEKCQKCGKKLVFNDAQTHYHHKDLYSQGGKTEVSKGVLLCADCHLKKIHGSRS
jgi:hypothetical protein